MTGHLPTNPPPIETRASTTTRSSTAKNEAQQLPLYSCAESSKLLYFRSSRQADIALSNIAAGPLGFDLEWRPVTQKGAPPNPIALIQLATVDTVYLIQVSAMEEFPQKLRDILQSSTIVKTGVGIQADTLKLYADFAVSTRACVDLSLLARSVDNSRWKGRYTDDISLGRLVNTYASKTLQKTSHIRRSDWQAILGPGQLEYAANDAHAGLTVYNHLCLLLADTTPVPKTSCYSFDCIHGRLCHPTGAFWSPYNPNYDSGLSSPGPPEPSQLTCDEPTALPAKDALLNDSNSQKSVEEQDLLPAKEIPD